MQLAGALVRPFPAKPWTSAISCDRTGEQPPLTSSVCLLNFFMAFLQPKALRSLRACGGQSEGPWLQWEQPLTPVQVPDFGSYCISLLCSWKSSQILDSPHLPTQSALPFVFCAGQEVQ